MNKKQNYIINFSLVIFSILLSLFIIEVLLRIFYPQNQFRSLYPNSSFEIYHKKNIFPGIEDKFRVSTNKFGYRGKHYFSDHKLGILGIGGSTTECLLVSDDKTWLSLLEKKWNTSQIYSNNVIVGNAGSSGLNSGHHVLQMQYMIPQYFYKNVKIILMLVGVNDYLRFLNMGDNYVPTAEAPNFFARAFIQYPRKYSNSWYKRTELYLLLRNVKNRWEKSKNTKFDDELLEILQHKIKKYKDSHKKIVLPDLSLGLMDYEANLLKIIQLAKTQDIRLIFLTQPVLWHKDIEGKEAQLASTGAPIIDGYSYTPEVLAKGMDLFNQRLKQTASKNHIEYIDIAHLLPKDTTVFFDYCHFNLSGNEQISNLVFDYLAGPKIEN